MEKEYVGSKIIPCKDIKNEHYVEILREYEEGINIFTSPSGEKYLKAKKWGCIPVLAQHPIAVRSNVWCELILNCLDGTIYLFSGNNRIQQITRGRFKQQGRKTNLRNSNKEIVGKKSNLILENHLQEGLIFRKHTMSLLSIEKPVLIHYSCKISRLILFRYLSDFCFTLIWCSRDTQWIGSYTSGRWRVRSKTIYYHGW